jgi:acetate kinase
VGGTRAEKEIFVKILALNAGSGSQKLDLYAIEQPPAIQPSTPVWEAYADWAERAGKVVLRLSTRGNALPAQELTAGSRAAILRSMLQMLWSGPAPVIQSPQEIAAIGHRVVHGGPRYLQSTRITPDVKAAIAEFAPLAPDHNQIALEEIAVTEEVFGGVPQVASFDTAFHAHLPPAAATYPGPYAWLEQGIHRYGFHGLSHHYCAERAAMLLGRDLAALRLLSCHLGGGSSLAAIQAGKSIDTTMGFTPLEGVMMNTRSGSVDPGILLYLLGERGYSVERLDRELNQESGLLGISGIAGDLRPILAERARGNPRAQLAFDVYVHRLRGGIGMMLAALGGIDAVIFTGGIGEHVAEVRSAACAPFAFMGLALDEAANSQASPDCALGAPGAQVQVLLIHTEEEWMIARDCWRLLHENA